MKMGFEKFKISKSFTKVLHHTFNKYLDMYM